MRVFRDIIRMNTKTGQMPVDAQPEALAVSRDPSKARGGLEPEDKYPPLTMKAIWEGYDKYREYASSPDPDKQQQAHEFLKRVAPVIGIGAHIPGVDPDAP
jgi:hypothetical protein